VPPPPKPADGGPSLEITMKFIRDKIDGLDPVSFAVYFHDDVAGSDWTYQYRYEITEVVAEPSACSINFHSKSERDRAKFENFDATFYLKGVEDIVVMPMEQQLKEWSMSSWSARVDPAVFVLKVHMADKKSGTVYFFDEHLANRVAKAVVRAAELCGGGNEAEPF